MKQHRVIQIPHYNAHALLVVPFTDSALWKWGLKYYWSQHSVIAVFNVIWNTACERHWKAGLSAAAASPPQTLTETEERAILWRLCRNLKIKWQRENGKKKDPQPLLKEKKTAENLRGVHFFVFWLLLFFFFFSERASCFCFCFCRNFALWERERRFGFHREEWNGPFGEWWKFFWFVRLLLFPPPSPSWIRETTFWTGVTYWNLGIPAWSGTRWNTETCCSTKKKISMALNCLNISKSNVAWGEKNAEERHLPPLCLLELRRLLGI